jgi:hypothetical protein
VDDVHVVQEAVEDGGGEDLVAGEDLGPVADVLVRGEDDRAFLVAGADQSEEEIRFLSVQGTEADLVDDKERVALQTLSDESASWKCNTFPGLKRPARAALG